MANISSQYSAEESMIYIVTNRNIAQGQNDEKLFGDDFNAAGPEVLRIAEAVYDTGWNLTLLEENMDDIDSLEPTYAVFDELFKDTRPCVVFIHGFNQSLEKNLKKCREIESYGVNVLAFSWPSNPGPDFILRKNKEYKRARKNARRSVFALERFFDKLESFVELKGSSGTFKTLAVHSLGNYLAQSFVQNPDFDNQTKVFKNILLHQADVDSMGHEKWVGKLGTNSRVLITINETDNVLDFSDIINPDRLGNTAANLRSDVAKYYDFTDAKGAEDSHRLWHEPASENGNIHVFFTRVFQGKNVKKTGVKYNPLMNAYEVS